MQMCDQYQESRAWSKKQDEPLSEKTKWFLIISALLVIITNHILGI